MGADTIIGNDVYNQKGEKLSDIKKVMLDMRSGRVAYAVLSFGGFLGMGEKLFAVPWNALTLDTATKSLKLNVDTQMMPVMAEIAKAVRGSLSVGCSRLISGDFSRNMDLPFSAK